MISAFQRHLWFWKIEWHVVSIVSWLSLYRPKYQTNPMGTLLLFSLSVARTLIAHVRSSLLPMSLLFPAAPKSLIMHRLLCRGRRYCLLRVEHQDIHGASTLLV